MSTQPATAANLDPTERDAYFECTWLARQYTFEQAMAIPAIARALKCTAEAMGKARRERLHKQPENFVLEQST